MLLNWVPSNWTEKNQQLIYQTYDSRTIYQYLRLFLLYEENVLANEKSKHEWRNDLEFKKGKIKKDL